MMVVFFIFTGVYCCSFGSMVGIMDGLIINWRPTSDGGPHSKRISIRTYVVANVSIRVVVRLSGERDKRFVNGLTSDGGPHSKRSAIRTYITVSHIFKSKGLRVIVGHVFEIMMLVVHIPATRMGGGGGR